MQTMLDVETLGTDPGCIVLSIGAYREDGVGREWILNLKDQQEKGLVIDDNTLAWWGRQPPEARTVLGLAKEGPPTVNALTELANFLGKKPIVWGCGANFDSEILEGTYKAFGLKAPWQYYNVRCYRTMREVFKHIPLPPRPGVHHNALDDAKYQWNHLQTILATIK